MAVILRNADITEVVLAPGVFQRPIVSKATGAQAITMGEVRVMPGYKIPWHYHSVEDVVLVRSGKGLVRVGDDAFPVEGGMSAIIPSGVRHQVENIGDEPLLIVFGFPSAEVDRHIV